MNLHFSYKTAKSPEIEKEINQHVTKLGRRLQAFRPELVHLHGTLDSGPPNAFNVSLNLRLPSGQISSHDSGDSPAAAVKTAFSELLAQVQRHKEFLRSEHKWRRENSATRFVSEQAEAAESLPQAPPKKRNGHAIGHATAAHAPESQSERAGNGHASSTEINEATFNSRPDIQSDVRGYIDAHLPNLDRFVTRELRYRESVGRLQGGLVSPEEVIDEAVVTALSAEEKPGNLSLQRWLYRLALQAINRVARGNGTDSSALPLEQSVGSQNVTASDEAFLQFHQPGETFNRGDVVPDRRIFNPEELAASDEMVDQLEQALRGAKPNERESFVLFAIEGFTIEEISVVTDRDPEIIRQEINAARAHLMKKLPANNALKQKLIEAAKVA
jgi:DNA-directed RNA polymerase specialized sigma24 family protein/ribosome-associated translation inhibitor RaiA